MVIGGCDLLCRSNRHRRRRYIAKIKREVKVVIAATTTVIHNINDIKGELLELPVATSSILFWVEGGKRGKNSERDLRGLSRENRVVKVLSFWGDKIYFDWTSFTFLYKPRGD